MLEVFRYKIFRYVFRYWKVLVILYSSWLVMVGLVSFPLFILEESCQVAMFATWAAKSAKDWDELEKGIGHLEIANQKLKWINLWFGWINPFSWTAYHSYAVNTEVFITSSRSLVEAKKSRKVTDQSY